MRESEGHALVPIRIVALAAISVLAAAPFAAGQVDRGERSLPQGIAELKLAAPLQTSGVGRPGTLHESLVGAVGRQQVIVRLKTPAVGKLDNVPLAELDYDRAGARVTRRFEILDEQRGFLGRCRKAAPSADVLTQVQTVLNAVFLDVDAAALPALAEDPAVERIAPVANYRMDLSETVPYIGAAAVQAAGEDGSGVRVAVLDSGIDYYHAALGGSGNPADYAADDPTIIEPGHVPDRQGGGWLRLRRQRLAGRGGPASSPIPTRWTTAPVPVTAPTSPTSSAAWAASPPASTSTR